MLNTPWYTENTACRAELGRYPLSIDIKASIFSYWQRLKHTAKNSLLCEAFQYATNYTTFLNILNNGDSIRKYASESTLTQQNLKKAGYNNEKSLRNEYARNWLEAQEALNTPWYTENTACRAELGRYPLSIDIKASIFSYWQRLKHTAKHSLLCEAFQYATNYTTFLNILNNGDSIRKYASESTLTQQNLKKAGYNNKKSLRNEYARNWLEAQESVSLNSRAKFTHEEVKKHYQFEDYLTVITNPAHRISVTRLRLGAHALRIQTGK